MGGARVFRDCRSTKTFLWATMTIQLIYFSFPKSNHYSCKVKQVFLFDLDTKKTRKKLKTLCFVSANLVKFLAENNGKHLQNEGEMK